MSVWPVRLLPLLVIADSDAELRDAVTRFVSARGYRVEPAADAETATELLRENQVDVLISDLAMRIADGTDLLSFARASAPTTRSIAIAANLTLRDRDTALRLGAIRVLDKPLALLELADAIELARDCADGFHGWMHRMSLVDVLQMYHHAGQSLVLNVIGGVDERSESANPTGGTVWFHIGELIHAECGDRTGMAALTALLTAKHGRLETSPLVQTTRTITGPFDHVLLDGLRSLDEGRAVAGDPAPVVDGWLDEPTADDLLDREAMVRWLDEHAPGARVWRIDADAPAIERLDSRRDQAETESVAPPSALGWAYELAELTDPAWTRVELTCGATAIALIRVPGVVLALARVVASEAMQRQFRVESVQLVRWLHDHAERST